jgi:uracil-DNA glycosylase
MSEYRFGYPPECDVCRDLPDPGRSLRVAPFFREGGRFRLMLVGQDPTVRKKPERVRHALMLDQPGGQLSRWLGHLFGEAFQAVTLYATNVVKCSFSRPPSEMEEGGLAFLVPYARRCKAYLAQEVKTFAPDLVIALGEPPHRIFREMLDAPAATAETMQAAFTGSFKNVSIDGVAFDYSPCLHIQTFRVAETYGESVARFKEGLARRVAGQHQ